MKLTRIYVLALVVTALSLSARAAAQNASADRYAAVAFSSSTKRYGYSYNCASLERARQLALSHCGTSDARIVGWSKNGYVAVARGHCGATGWGFANDAASARRLALANCLRFSSYAVIVVSVSAQQ